MPRSHCIFLVLLLLNACGDGAPEDDRAAARTELVRGNGGDPESLDPAQAEDIHAFRVLGDLYEGLVVTTANGSVAPGVAESWTVSDDGLRYQFSLRADARWSNGDPVTAMDFVRAIRRVVGPATPSAYAFLFEPLANYQRVLDGSAPPETLGVQAPDDRTLTIQLTSPASHFLSVLTMAVAMPVHASMTNGQRFDRPETFLGNGPYVLAEYQAGGPIRLRANEYFHDAESTAIQDVSYLPVVDPATELRMFRAGEIDITATVPADALVALREQRPAALKIAPGLALYYLAFDLSEPPFDDVQLRKALSTAINREVLSDLLGRGEVPAYGLVPESVTGYQPARYKWANLDAPAKLEIARSAYREAGYSEEQPLEVTLTYDAGDVHEKIAIAVSEMWRQNLGVEVELQQLEWKIFLATRERRNSWDVMRFAWFGDYDHASTFTGILASDSLQNLPGYSNPAYDQLLEKAASATESSVASTLLLEAEQLAINDYPIAPLYFYVNKHLVHESIGGFENNSLDRHPSRYLYKRSAQ